MVKTHQVMQLFNLDSKYELLKSLEYIMMTGFNYLHCGNSTVVFCLFKKWDHLHHKPHSWGYVGSVQLPPQTSDIRHPLLGRKQKQKQPQFAWLVRFFTVLLHSSFDPLSFTSSSAFCLFVFRAPKRKIPHLDTFNPAYDLFVPCVQRLAHSLSTIYSKVVFISVLHTGAHFTRTKAHILHEPEVENISQ